MDIQVCKQCGSRFVYCRKCVFKPVRYKDAGFCSKECYEASKNKVVEVEPIVEEVAIEEVIVENNDESSVEDIKTTEEEILVEDEAEAVVLAEDSIIEATTVVKPTIKKETYNTYKNKKNKYKVHE